VLEGAQRVAIGVVDLTAHFSSDQDSLTVGQRRKQNGNCDNAPADVLHKSFHDTVKGGKGNVSQNHWNCNSLFNAVI
jgi:hypothetical protein